MAKLNINGQVRDIAPEPDTPVRTLPLRKAGLA
jgi:hypothetical protein